MKLTKAGVSDRMQYINPMVYVDMDKTALHELYNKMPENYKFKGFHVMAIDGSIIEIPNVKLTREEFDIPENTQLNSYKSTARISCMVDTRENYIISSNISYKDTSELEHALFHLDDASSVINSNKTITVYDRGYNSTELMLKTQQLQSYFIIRARKSMFKKQQLKMKTNDETFKINLNNSKTQHFHCDNLKEYAIKQKRMKIRIVKVKLKNGIEEILLTNLNKETASPEELKELYGERWTIEKNYDRLKNKLQIEKFTGRKRIRIEQDFYSHILIFNLLMSIKNDTEREINNKTSENKKNHYKYQSNINILIGKIKELMPDLLTNDKEQRQKTINAIMETGKQNLVTTKIEEKPNNTREKKKYYHKKCKSNIRESF